MNPEVLRQSSLGDARLMGELALVVLQDMPEQRQRFQDAQTLGDAATARRAPHSAKSIARQGGGTRLAAIKALLEAE